MSTYYSYLENVRELLSRTCVLARLSFFVLRVFFACYCQWVAHTVEYLVISLVYS
jgi:lysine/ornithine N-monooxygenase